jgi:predicted transcriptional regulator
MPKDLRPTEYELQILQIVWRRGASTVEDVSNDLNVGKSLAYTTVQTMLNRMVGKKLLVRVKEGRSFKYAARVSETATKRGLIRSLVEVAFGGSVRALVSGLLREGELSQDDLKRLALELEEPQQQAENKSNAAKGDKGGDGKEMSPGSVPSRTGNRGNRNNA